MRKKLILLCMLICSFFCVTACKADPYENMTITATMGDVKITEDTVIPLSISSIGDVYNYDDIKTINIKVSDDNSNTDLSVQVGDGLGYVNVDKIYNGDGSTSLRVKPVSFEKTGNFALEVKTNEGNKSLNINFSIDLQLNNFEFNSSSLKALGKGDEIDLSQVDDYIDFDPVATTQKNIKFEFASFVDLSGHFVVDGWTDSGYSFIDVNTDVSLNSYATLQNNILKLNADKNAVYPKYVVSSSQTGETFNQECVVLKATYTNPSNPNISIIKFKVVPVVSQCSDIQLSMNSQKSTDETIQIAKNKQGAYDVILLDPNFQSGFASNNITYYIERNLMFSLFDREGNLTNDYYVETEEILDDNNSNSPILIYETNSFVSDVSTFRVEAQKTGKTTHTFYVRHVNEDFRDVFVQEIKVNFIVQDVPLTIKINDEKLANKYTIYDYYQGADGRKLKVDLENTVGDYKFFVAIDDVLMADQIYLSSSKTISRGVFAVIEEGKIYSTSQDKPYSVYNDLETLYLRHQLTTIPKDTSEITIGVIVSMFSNSYGENLKDKFIDLCVLFPLNISYEYSVRQFTFEKNEYYINLTNENYCDKENITTDYIKLGNKLLDLPLGLTVERAIESIDYNKELVTVYDVYDEETDITSLYVLSNNKYLEGDTEIKITSKNGVVGKTLVHTYIPSGYIAKTEGSVVETENKIVEIDTKDAGYLYHFNDYYRAGGDPNISSLQSSVNIIDNYSRSSVKTIFMLLNNQVEIKFFDFYKLGYAYVEYDITKEVFANISSIDDNYIKYENGVLTALKTTDTIYSPVQVVFSFVGAYEDENGEYKTLTISQTIEIYIYKPLEKVEIKTERIADLYLSDQLSYFDKSGDNGKDLSSNTIIAEFAPDELSLGGAWNNTSILDGSGVDGIWTPIRLDFESGEFDLNKIVVDAEGNELILYDGFGLSYPITYKDLFKITRNANTCKVEFRLNDEENCLKDKLLDYGIPIDEFVRNYIQNRGITLTINVTVSQFDDRLKNVNTVTYSLKAVDKIKELNLNVDDDGIYFDARNFSADDESKNIVSFDYSIDNAKALNKNIRFIGDKTNSFDATAIVGLNNTGKINIQFKANDDSTKLTGGIYYLTVIPEDNIKDKSYGGEKGYFDSKINQEIRIKIADGSKDYPFEIKTLQDFKNMIKDIEGGNNYYYVIARDIDLKNLGVSSIKIKDATEKILSISGSHSYVRNGAVVQTYNKIYNLTINKTLDFESADIVNIGLFDTLYQNVVFRDLSMVNASIKLSGVVPGGKQLNVGILAGSSDGNNGAITVTNSMFSGNIDLSGVYTESAENDVVIGGVVGNAYDFNMRGLPATYSQGIASTGNNVYVTINAKNKESKELKAHIGGVVGISSGQLQNLQVVSSIDSLGAELIGGVAGTFDGEFSEIQVSPTIRAVKAGSVGGAIGLLSGSISNIIVYFVNIGEEYSWQEKANIIVEDVDYVGGLVGNIGASAGDINYSYVRSFYNEEISNTYKGNIYAKNTNHVYGVAHAVMGSIRNSYFDGDIVVSNTDNKVEDKEIGLLFGANGNAYIYYSYAIGKLYYENAETFELTKVYSLGNLNNIIASNSYMVINGKLYYGNNFVNEIIVGDDSINYSFFKTILENISDGSEDVKPWFYNADINHVKNGEKVSAFPILLDQNGKAMYDLLPTSIGIIVNNKPGFFDLSQNAQDGIIYQMLMFANKTASGEYSKDYYQIKTESAGDNQVAIKVVFQGNSINTTYVKIPLNDQIEINLKNNVNSAIEFKDNKIYPRNEGYAEIEIKSYLDKSIKMTFAIQVVNGVTEFELQGYQLRRNPYNVASQVSTISSEGEDSIEDYVSETASVYASNDINTIYVDEVSDYRLVNTNSQGKYLSTNKIGYIVEILSSSTAIVEIEGMPYTYSVNNSNIFEITSLSSLAFIGRKIGYFDIKVTSYIVLDNVNYDTTYGACSCRKITCICTNVKNYKNIYILNDLTKEFNFTILTRATAIQVDKPYASIDSGSFVLKATVETTNIIDNKIYENIHYKIYKNGQEKNARGFSWPWPEGHASYNPNVEPFFYGINSDLFEYELLTFHMYQYEVNKTHYNTEGKPYTYQITFYITVTFNKDYYRKHADEYDLNTLEFDFEISPSSNSAFIDPFSNVKAKSVITITPAVLSDIFTNYYHKGEGLVGDELNTYPNDNESKFIVPGRDGLLKITLNEEFNNSSYIEITLDKKYQGYVSINQMYATLKGGKYTSDDVNEYIDGYQDCDSLKVIETDKVFGLRLAKMSINLRTDTYFNNTYYVKVSLSREYGNLKNIEFVITSYTILGNNNVVETLEKPKVVSLTVTDVPSIVASVENETSFFMGVGVKKKLDISYKALEHNINIVSSRVEYLWVEDDDGNRVEELSLQYIDEGRSYYLCLAVDIFSKEKEDWFNQITLSLNGEEYIFGILEKTTANLFVNPVEFEITSFEVLETLPSGDENIMNLEYNESKVLTTKINYRPVIVQIDRNSVPNKCQSYEGQILTNLKSTSIDDGYGRKQLVQYQFAGTEVSKGGVYYSNGELFLKRIVYVDGNTETESLSYGAYDKFSILDGNENRNGVVQNSGLDFKFTYIKATSLTDDVILRLDFPYYYQNGLIVVGNNQEYYYEPHFEFRLIVDDSSSIDHPYPIEKAEDLIEALESEQTSANYILVNDIYLEDWMPRDINFASLDGNGYRFIIKSFNMSSLRGQNNVVNAGIFATISKNTILKNIIIDVSNILISSTYVQNNLNVLANSTIDTYVHDQVINGVHIDLTYTEKVNFGLLAGTNKGAVTNVKVISTSNSKNDYLQVLTTNGYLNNRLVETNIGAIIGVNEEGGAISNSFAGLNKSHMVGDSSFVEMVGVIDPNKTLYNNSQDFLFDGDDIRVYPFTLTGSRVVGGIAGVNSGVISNTYIKGLGVYNVFPTVHNSFTGGLVATNNGTLTSCFAESSKVNGITQVDPDEEIEAVGSIGGLVYENKGTIENSYTNIKLVTQSAFTGGFVYTNSGEIRNSYATSSSNDSLAHGPFTGVKSREVQNTGVYKNVYYLISSESEDDTALSVKEHATEIKYNSEMDDEVKKNFKSFFTSFSFVSGDGEDGIWKQNDDGLPEIATTLTDTVSFRVLEGKESIGTDSNTGENIEVFSYSYRVNNQGSAKNPLLIDKAENFDKYIIDKMAKNVDYNGEKINIFGAQKTSDSFISNSQSVRHVRLVNNLDFTKIAFSNQYSGINLYNSYFAGVLDGNGMVMDNLNLVTNTIGLKNFGLFAQIGAPIGFGSEVSVIKNLNVGVRTFGSANSSKAGIFAGTIINTTIANVKVDGNDVEIRAVNMAGAIAGLIDNSSDSNVTIRDVIIENVDVGATYTSIGGSITNFSEDMSKYFYNSFKINTGNGIMSSSGHSFNTLYVNGSTNKDNYNSVSYAGAVAGVLIANNDSKALDDFDISNWRTTDESTIDNIVVRNNIKISTADQAGGLFGYVSEKTRIRNSRFVVSDGQLIKGFNYVGGLVGENHGIIEQCFVEHDTKTQEKYDATIINNTRDSGTLTLFKNDNEFYAVAVGGLVGYTENGVIIDSYSKVNVIHDSAFVAGGLVGYAKGKNFLSYLYTTGGVFAKEVIGGIIGMNIVNSDDNGDEKISRTIIRNTVGLNDWNVPGYMEIITRRLYDDQKLFYKNEDAGYYDFYINMPEVGNQQLYISNEPDKILLDIAKATQYANNHSVNYIGSVIGKSFEMTSAMFAEGVEMVFISPNNNGIYSNFESSSKVFSTIFGLHSVDSGSLENNNRQDAYYNNSVSVDVGLEEKVDIRSYVPTNGHDFNITYPSDGYSKNISFNGVFASQEYIQQTLGEYYTTDASNGMQRTTNILRYGYTDKDNRYNNYTGGDVVFESAELESLWIVEDYLPKINDGTGGSVINVPESASLKDAFESLEKGKVYYINSGTYYIDLTTESANNYNAEISSTFIGEVKNNVGVTINLKVSESGPNTIFKSIAGSRFENIIFDIDYQTTEQYTRDTSGAYGIFANSIQNTLFKNCQIDLTTTNNANIVENFKPTDAGLVFGYVSNCTFETTIIKVTCNGDDADQKAVSLNTNTIQNFGLIAGRVNNSYINNSTIQVAGTTINITSASTNLNIGGLFGSITGGRFVDNKISEEGVPLVTINNYVLGSQNVSSLFGYVNGTIIDGDGENNKNLIKLTYNNYVDLISSETSYVVNIGLLAGKSNKATIRNFELGVQDDKEDVAVLVVKSLRDTGAALDPDSQEFNIGGLVGQDNSSNIGGEDKEKDLNVGVFEKLEIKVKSNKLSFGGIIGKSASTNLTNVYNKALIESTLYNGTVESFANDYYDDNAEGSYRYNYKYTYRNSYIGGLVGYASNLKGKGLLNSNNLHIIDATKPVKLQNLSLGGIVGYAISGIELENFVALNDFKVELTGGDKPLLGGDDDSDDLTKSNNHNIINVGGIIGNNKTTFKGINGYSYVELPEVSGPDYNTTAITNGSVSRETEGVYYAQEFVGSDYDSDMKFKNFAMADVYNADVYNNENVNNPIPDGGISNYSEYSKTFYHISDYKLEASCKVKFANIGYVRLALPTKLVGKYKVNVDGALGETRFKPNATDFSKAYNVRLTDYNGTGGMLLEGIVSGRTIADGKKVTITLTTEEGGPTTNFINTNDGVLSNLYLKTYKETTTNDVNDKDKDGKITRNNVLVGNNNGLITNCLVYGTTTSAYSIAGTNKGRIYQCASNTIYLGGKNAKEDAESATNDITEVYGIVYENDTNGVIVNSYSYSYANIRSVIEENDKNNAKARIYIAHTNYGVITNSFYFFPELMEFCNINSGVAKHTQSGETDAQGKPDKVKQTSASFGPNYGGVTSYPTIWTKENGHTQLVGFKDIPGSIVSYVGFYLEDNEGNIGFGEYTLLVDDKEAVESEKKGLFDFVKNKIDGNSSLFTEHGYGLKLDFFVKDDKIPNYEVIRIYSGVELQNYLNSLTKSNDVAIVPSGTIIAICNDITVDSSLLPEFTLQVNSALIGIRFKNESGEGCTPIPTIKFNDVELLDKNTKEVATPEDKIKKLTHAFINENNGLIANINLLNLYIESSDKDLATIRTNNGVIVNFNLLGNTSLIASRVGISVAGMVYHNNGGKIIECKITTAHFDNGKGDSIEYGIMSIVATGAYSDAGVMVNSNGGVVDIKKDVNYKTSSEDDYSGSKYE